MTIVMETFIHAPPELVFDLARDIGLHQELASESGERAIAGRTSGLIELNEDVTWRARHLGVWLTHRSRIAALEKPRHFKDVMVAGTFQSFVHDHVFEAVDGGTVMRDVLAFSAPLGPIGRIAEAVFLRGYMRRFLEHRNEALRAVAEDRSRG